MAKPCSAWTRTLASVRFGDHHPPHRVGLVRLRDQFLTQARQPCLQALLLDLSEAHPVHTRSARVVASQPVGVAQDVFPADLVVEHIEAEGGLRLRLAIELPLKAPDLLRCCQAHRQSPSPHHLRKHPRSQGPLLRRRYPASTLIRPCPTPAVAIAQGDAEAATLANNGSPPITRTTFPSCRRRAAHDGRAHYPGGSSGCACRLLPRSCSLPQMAGGSASALSLSRPAQASLALRPAGSLSRPRRPLSRGSDPASYPTKPLASFRTYRQLSGWNPPPLMIRAFGAHCQEQTFDLRWSRSTPRSSSSSCALAASRAACASIDPRRLP